MQLNCITYKIINWLGKFCYIYKNIYDFKTNQKVNY